MSAETAAKRYVIDRIEAISMLDVSSHGLEWNAIPSGIRVHVMNRGGDAWLDWPANAGEPRIGQGVIVGITDASS